MSGSGGMYVSGDGGATNGYNRLASGNSRFHWAVRPLLTAYPNPSRGDVTVAVSEPTVITVVDLQGRTIVPPTPVDTTFLIPHSSLPHGTYYLRATSASGTAVRKLTVVR